MSLPPIALPPEIEHLLSLNAPVGVGVSGGKDSMAVGIAMANTLTSHQGPKVLIHSDLGSVEWDDSIRACQRLAEAIGWELIVCARPAGGMMERWRSRWQSSITRYKELSTVALVLPWSTASMRFCTSELKSCPIASALKKRFGNTPIISVTGIRAEESRNRAKMPVAKPNSRLPAGSLDWNPILHWKLADVWTAISEARVRPHEAYGLYGNTRVSCRFCILSSQPDLKASLKDPASHPVYQAMCDLELESAFSFQSNKWLSENALYLIPDGEARLAHAKQVAEERREAEVWLPKHLQFTRGWPTVMPTPDECADLAAMRFVVAQLYEWRDAKYLGPKSVAERYRSLLDQKSKGKPSDGETVDPD